MSDNLVCLVRLHSVALLYTLHQLEAHTVLNTGQVARCEVKSANNVLSKPVRPLEQAELADFPPRVGNVEVAGAALAGDILDGLHDQVRRTLGLLYRLQKWIGGSKSFFCSRGSIG